MKLIPTLIITIALLLSFHNKEGIKPRVFNETETDTIVIGDINNDKIIDTAFVKGPKWINEEDGWGDPKFYNINISFSCNVPDITNDNAVGAYVENIGDIDNDGFSEIIVVPGWWIGCWGRLHFYSFKKGKWKHLDYAERNVCEDDNYKQYITKINNHKIKITEQVWDGDEGDRIEKPKFIIVK